MAKVNFLANKEILKEIHKSKNTYSYYVDKQYGDYNIIIDDLSNVTTELINETREKIASTIDQEERQRQREAGVKSNLIKIDPTPITAISLNQLIVREMTYEHIPDIDPSLIKGTPKKPKDFKVKLNFPPYRHYKIEYDGDEFTENVDVSKITFKEVGRSHWRQGLENGEFCDSHGKMTDRLAQMFLKLVDRYSQKPNWRGYSYLDEMKNQALLQLIQVGLKFDESRSQNPFAYYTTIMTHSFTGIFNQEKKAQTIRDDMLQMHGQAPSYTRMTENDMANSK